MLRLIWPAVDFFNMCNMLYGTVSEFCTPHECPVMSAGPRCVEVDTALAEPRSFEYHCASDSTSLSLTPSAGQDGVNYKKPTKLSAPEYVDALMNWVQVRRPRTIALIAQGMLDDEAIFPSKVGAPFPRTFHATIRSIVRRLFRVYAHLYNVGHAVATPLTRSQSHFAVLCALSIEAHINTSYRALADAACIAERDQVTSCSS